MLHKWYPIHKYSMIHFLYAFQQSGISWLNQQSNLDESVFYKSVLFINLFRVLNTSIFVLLVTAGELVVQVPLNGFGLERRALYHVGSAISHILDAVTSGRQIIVGIPDATVEQARFVVDAHVISLAINWGPVNV